MRSAITREKVARSLSKDGEGWAGDAEDAGGVGHREAVGGDDLVLDESAGVGGALHADAGGGAHGGFSVIVLFVGVAARGGSVVDQASA